MLSEDRFSVNPLRPGRADHERAARRNGKVFVGRTGRIRGGSLGVGFLLLVASLRACGSVWRRDMRGYVIPFVVATILFGGGFLALDYAVMSLQGLTLIYQP